MEDKSLDLAWRLAMQLRTEMIEAQKTRTQIIGFKITYVGAGIGLILSNINVIPSYLLIIPALSAVFFDFLIVDSNNSINSIRHYYIRNVGDKKLLEEPMWETFTWWSKDDSKDSFNCCKSWNNHFSYNSGYHFLVCSFSKSFIASLASPYFTILPCRYYIASSNALACGRTQGTN